WVRSPSGQPAAGAISLWGIGFSPTEGVSTPFVAGPGWTLVTTTLDPQQSHTMLRAQVYLTTPGVDFNLDGALLTPQLLRNASFDASTALAWHWDPTAQVL